MTTPTATTHIDQVRQHLMTTLADLRDRSNPMEVDRARAIAQVASVLVDTAKVEIDYLKATSQDRSSFLEMAASPGLQGIGQDNGNQAKLTATGTLVRDGSTTRHTLRG